MKKEGQLTTIIGGDNCKFHSEYFNCGSRVNIRSKTYMFNSDFEKTTSFKDIKE